MITSIRVENFRGIEKLEVKDFGRVNLIIGRNNSGKTALLEALILGEAPEAAGQLLVGLQISRLHGLVLEASELELRDFNGLWRPIFLGGDVERGFKIVVVHDPGGEVGLAMHRTNGHSPIKTAGLPGFSASQRTWTLEYKVTRQGTSRSFELKGSPDGVLFPDEAGALVPEELSWVSTRVINEPLLTHQLSKIKRQERQEREEELNELLGLFEGRIKGLEILSSASGKAALFVRLGESGMTLPFRMAGDGMQRTLDIAIGIASTDWPCLTVDEIENGVHHSLLGPLWSWIAKVSKKKGLQIFATTHSEECMQAAASAFKELDDDGLRVIRLDRREHETRAAVYDKELVLSAERTGVEIRG